MLFGVGDTTYAYFFFLVKSPENRHKFLFFLKVPSPATRSVAIRNWWAGQTPIFCSPIDIGLESLCKDLRNVDKRIPPRVAQTFARQLLRGTSGLWLKGVSRWLKAAFSLILHPGRLTWNLKITHLERKMIFQTSMIMFRVNLPGCKRWCSITSSEIWLLS